MDTLQPETMLTTSEAAALCPRRTSSNSLWRWARRGVKARGGETIRLRHIRQGGTILIPESALPEFFEALAQADAEHFDREPETAPTPVAKRGKRAAHDQARAMLAKHGL